MSVQFILGGSGCGKTYYIQHCFLREAKMFPDRQYIFLVPEQFTMQTQKELIENSKEKGILNIDVQSFIRLAFRVFSETGANHMPVLDDMGKTMILKKVLASLEERLGYFGKNVHKTGYVQEIKSFLSELFQYHADEKTIENMILAAKKKPLLIKKLEDMKIIYREFLEYIREHYITSEEVMNVLAKVTEKSDFLRDSVVCLDGFTGFTPTQYAFIERLIRVAKKVYITVTIDKRVSIIRPEAKHGLFYLSQKTLYHIRKLAGENGVEVCPEIWVGNHVEETRFKKAPGIQFLERELFRFPVKKSFECPLDLSIHRLKQPEDEVDFVVHKIRTLLYEKKCRYRDIAVVTGDLATYGMIAKDRFLKADMPCFLDQKKGTMEHPFVDLIDSVIEIFLSNFRAEKIMQFEKNIFSLATKEQSDILDNFLRASGIFGYQKWQQVWNGSILFEKLGVEEKREFELLLDTVRLETIDQLGELYDQIGKRKHTVKEYAEAFCKWMEREKYYYKLEKQVERFEEQNEKALAWEYRQVYQIVLNVFDQLVELLGDEVLNLKEFKEILDIGFAEARIGLIPPGVDQVLIGDMNRSRLANIKYLFFLGMNDGIIPQSSGRGGVISDAERQFLSDEEFELAPTVRESVYMEQFYLYLNLTKPEKHLYLTFCETGTDGKAKKPAYIIDRIQKMFPNLSQVIEENRTDDSYLLGNWFGREFLIKGLRSRQFQNEKWREVFRFYKSDDERNERLNNWIEAAFYKEMQTKLSKHVVHALYEEVLSGSTSQFEQYAACAFAYFMRYGLNLAERKEHQIAFFDIGNIAHAAIDQYTKKLISNGKNWTDLSEEEQKREADLCVEETVQGYKNGIFMQTARDSYLISRLKRIVRRSILVITKQMEKGEFKTVTSEFGFEILERRTGEKLQKEMERESAGEKLQKEMERERAGESLQMEEENEILRLIGRVDRIDEMEEERKVYLKIVDYKTGKKDISLSELYYGLQMQLMIYLKAGMEKQKEKTKKLVVPAGILYYHIDDPMIEKKAGETKEEMELRIIQGLKMDGLVNEDDPVLQSLDESFKAENGGLLGGVKSDVFPFATTKQGMLSKTSKTVTTREFEMLLGYTEEKLLQIQDGIMEGNIAVEPYREENMTACMYCPYHSVCRFDVKIPGNRYRDLKKLSRDEVMKKIGGNEAAEQME